MKIDSVTGLQREMTGPEARTTSSNQDLYSWDSTPLASWDWRRGSGLAEGGVGPDRGGVGPDRGGEAGEVRKRVSFDCSLQVVNSAGLAYGAYHIQG